MPKYRISSGEIRGFEVEAPDYKEAFRLAVEAHPDAALGLIFSIEEDGEEEKYAHTMRTLKEVGLHQGELDPVFGLPIEDGEDAEAILNAAFLE